MLPLATNAFVQDGGTRRLTLIGITHLGSRKLSKRLEALTGLWPGRVIHKRARYPA